MNKSKATCCAPTMNISTSNTLSVISDTSSRRTCVKHRLRPLDDAHTDAPLQSLFHVGLVYPWFVHPVVLVLIFAVIHSLTGIGPNALGMANETPLPEDVVFLIGDADNCAGELNVLPDMKTWWESHQQEPCFFRVGVDSAELWPHIHPSSREAHMGYRPWTIGLRFSTERFPALSSPSSPSSLPHPTEQETPESNHTQQEPWYFVLGLCGSHRSEHSLVTVTVNDTVLPSQRAPENGSDQSADSFHTGIVQTMFFAIPPEAIVPGENRIQIHLNDGSWIVYDYIALRRKPEPIPQSLIPPNLLYEKFRDGPMNEVKKIVFAERRLGPDGHWYANFSYYGDIDLPQGEYETVLHENEKVTYRDGTRLCLLDLTTREVSVLLDDPKGGIRDPVVHYDAEKILFAWRRNGVRHYHLYEIGVDGSGLRQITDGGGDYDDIEPTYLPDGDILFISSRCRRWVNCWATQVATLHRCGPNGENVRELSSNNEQDNTPWVLPNGQILYTRWEYVDRSQIEFHHLWTMTPQGERQMVFFGNLHPQTTMIDAKPIPNSGRIIASFSPGHGIREHQGFVTIVDPRCGPDEQSSAKQISRDPAYRDPWAFSETAFMAARGAEIVLMDARGRTETLYTIPESERATGLECHEPRPIIRRKREPLVADITRSEPTTGRFLVTDVYRGRNMGGVQRGDIRKLLVLETLPQPVHFSGGMEPISLGGTFILERIVGTVPVEPDGSAFFEAPALRSFFFVALDEKDRSVKRMQSFTSLVPGETQTCIGCHEQRTDSPPIANAEQAIPLAAKRPPDPITPVPGIPDVMDFPRDIQPILDRHCVECHGPDRRDAGVELCGDRGPMYSISYYTIMSRRLVADGNNQRGNRPPRTIGTSASKLIQMLDEHHQGVVLSPEEWKYIQMWIESGAVYPGTYAAVGSGMIGAYFENRSYRDDLDWDSAKRCVEAIERRCGTCHQGDRSIARIASEDGSWRYPRHLMYNLTRPEKSPILMAPLAKSAGGRASCLEPNTGAPIFADTNDPDYQTIRTYIIEAKAYLEKIGRFDMPGFQPRSDYLREMKRYGILSNDLLEHTPVDPYATDRKYWESLWP